MRRRSNILFWNLWFFTRFIPRDEAEYVNPYMVEDKDDILAKLRRDTANDRRNKKNYKREVQSFN